MVLTESKFRDISSINLQKIGRIIRSIYFLILYVSATLLKQPEWSLLSAIVDRSRKTERCDEKYRFEIELKLDQFSTSFPRVSCFLHRMIYATTSSTFYRSISLAPAEN